MLDAQRRNPAELRSRDRLDDARGMAGDGDRRDGYKARLVGTARL